METIGIELTRIFIKVVQQGSFSKAAELLNIPKSTVSKAITRLEAETGTKLLLRTTRSQTLTPSGRAFFETCLEPLQILEDAQKSLYGQDDIVAGKIRQNLKKFISNGELIGKKGDEFVSIPIPSIELPKFVFGKNQGNKVGQGKGNPGDPVDGEEQESGDPREAGDEEGTHELEVDVSLRST